MACVDSAGAFTLQVKGFNNLSQQIADFDVSQTVFSQNVNLILSRIGVYGHMDFFVFGDAVMIDASQCSHQPKVEFGEAF